MTRTVLILGATGRFGRNAAEQFWTAGWTVKTFDRSRDSLNLAAQGADVIVNGWNPAYPEWAKTVPRLHAQVIEAARLSKATVIVPGNVYVYGADTPAPWSEATPHQAQNSLGRVRVKMERAYAKSGVRTIILRAGDFIDSQASGNWFDMIMAKKLSMGRFVYPGDPDIDHSWAYLPDLCRAAVQLAEMRHDLPQFCDVPFPGYTASGADMAGHLGAILGRKVVVKRMNWLQIKLMQPVWPLARCLVEMSYLWRTAHSLDGVRFQEVLPAFQETPIEQALASAIPASLFGDQINPNQPVAAGT
ncbi:sugar nucleotide-binding protein [Tropicibacter sp. Alg240-R139]|uniref:sugar nucleotide-binding protein n=1 Tax=Tropicibacter sp. Alg240-R139 TaxID=2305991 RepID=UPI0013E035C9|nr:sugar nucleotide-binding protein [Tropicibacter sp. Alg240-R139]